MNVGDIVVVTDLENYTPKSREDTPFAAELFKIDGICYWVRNVFTDKEYELYEYQISPLEYKAVYNPGYDGTNSYYLANDDFITAVYPPNGESMGKVWESTKPKTEPTHGNAVIVGGVIGTSPTNTAPIGPFVEKEDHLAQTDLYHIWLEGSERPGDTEPAFVASRWADSFEDAINLLLTQEVIDKNFLTWENGTPNVFGCRYYRGVSETNNEEVK